MKPDLPAPTTRAGLFSPLRLGAFELQHRVVMPAWTMRLASAPQGVPTEAMAAHYAERASPGGLLICEASAVRAHAHADRCTPGLYSAEQVNFWRATTDAVHERGGIALAQLGQPAADARGALVSSLDADAIDEWVDAYRDAAENAGDAGFDGVELLGGHGALPELVLHGLCTRRQDELDGAADNRGRLLVDLLQALAGVWGAARCGLCLSPAGAPDDGERAAALSRLLGAVEAQGIAYLHIAAPWHAGEAGAALRRPGWPDTDWLRAAYRGAIVVSGGYSPAEAEAEIASGLVDAVGFGRAFIADPELPARLRAGLPSTL